MGLTEVLTIIFVILKLTHTVGWSWWLVLLPEIIGVGFYLLMWVLAVAGFVGAVKRWDRS